MISEQNPNLQPGIQSVDPAHIGLTANCPLNAPEAPLSLLFDATHDILAFEAVDAVPRVWGALEASAQICSTFQFIAVNPIDRGAVSKDQTNFNTCYNFLIESDTISISEAVNFFLSETCTLKPRTLTFSGSKSVHAVYSLNTPVARADYKKYFYALYYELTRQYKKVNASAPKIVFDRSASNPNRLTRMPNGTRSNGVKQQLLYTGPMLTVEELQPHVRSKPDTQSLRSMLPRKKINSLEEFESYLQRSYSCPAFLRNWLTPHSWMQPANNRAKIFRDCLYIYESLDVTPEILISFVEKYWLTAAAQAGYTSNMHEPIYSSLNYLEAKSALT